VEDDSYQTWTWIQTYEQGSGLDITGLDDDISIFIVASSSVAGSIPRALPVTQTTARLVNPSDNTHRILLANRGISAINDDDAGGGGDNVM
jgi:hypothetical protein